MCGSGIFRGNLRDSIWIACLHLTLRRTMQTKLHLTRLPDLPSFVVLLLIHFRNSCNETLLCNTKLAPTCIILTAAPFSPGGPSFPGWPYGRMFRDFQQLVFRILSRWQKKWKSNQMCYSQEGHRHQLGHGDLASLEVPTKRKETDRKRSR